MWSVLGRVLVVDRLAVQRLHGDSGHDVAVVLWLLHITHQVQFQVHLSLQHLIQHSNIPLKTLNFALVSLKLI